MVEDDKQPLLEVNQPDVDTQLKPKGFALGQSVRPRATEEDLVVGGEIFNPEDIKNQLAKLAKKQ